MKSGIKFHSTSGLRRLQFLPSLGQANCDLVGIFVGITDDAQHLQDRRSAVDKKVCAPEIFADLTSNSSSVFSSCSYIVRACRVCASTTSSDQPYARTSLSVPLSLRLSQSLLSSLFFLDSPGGLGIEACRSRDTADGSTLLSRGREKGSVGVILGCLVLDGITLDVWLAYTYA